MAERATEATLPDWWAERVAVSPGATVLRTAKREISYCELDHLSDRIASAAPSLGLSPRTTVAIQLPASAAFLALILGFAKAGVRCSLLSPGLRGRSLRHALQEVSTAALVTGPRGRDAAAGSGVSVDGIAVLALDGMSEDRQPLDDGGIGAVETWLEGARLQDALPDEVDRPGPDETLFYIFTSGTTGLPKATQCSHRRYVSGGIAEGIFLGLDQSDRVYVVLPMFHIAALSLIAAALSVSGAIFIRPRFSATSFWDDVREHRLTGFQYLGEIVRYLLAQPPKPDDREHTIRAMMGAGLSKEVWEAFVDRFGEIRIVEAYGSSEGVFGITNLDGVPGSVGRPAPAIEARLRIAAYDTVADELVRDADGRLIVCAEGEVGELIAKLEDASEFEGYSSAEATRAKLIEGAFADGDLWYRSGDLFRQTEGFYFFAGRLGETYRWKGENISALEVSEALETMDEIARAVVYPVLVTGHEGSAGMALIHLESGHSFDAEALYARITAELPASALPLFVRVGDPERDGALTETYKIGVAALKREGYARREGGDQIYLLDARNATYVELDRNSLEAAGLPEFAEHTKPTEA